MPKTACFLNEFYSESNLHLTSRNNLSVYFGEKYVISYLIICVIYSTLQRVVL